MPHLGHDQVPAISPHFLVRQGRQHLGIGSIGHGGRCWPRSPGHRRDDAHGVAGIHQRVLFLKIPDVVIVHVDVDEAAQSPIFRVQMVTQFAVLRRQVREHLANRAALDLDDILFCPRTLGAGWESALCSPYACPRLLVVTFPLPGSQFLSAPFRNYGDAFTSGKRHRGCEMLY